MGITITVPTVGGDNGTWGTELNAILAAIVACDQFASRTSDSSNLTSATLADDGVLAVTLGVGTYMVEVMLLFTGSTTSADLKTAWAFTGTMTNQGAAGFGPSSAITSPLANNSVFDAAVGSTTASVTAARTYGVDATNISAALEKGRIVVTVGGTLKVQTANAAGAGNTVVKVGSYLWARQVA